MAFAHRGFSLGGLENTLTAFRAARDLGFTHLETDVRATRDGEVVAFHDDRLDRVTDRTGLLAHLDWAQVAAARVGGAGGDVGGPAGGAERIPLFSEVAEELPDTFFNVDVKEAAAVVPFAEVIERMGLHERVLVTSFSDARRRGVLERLSRPVASSAGVATAAAFRLLGAVPDVALAQSLRDVQALQVPERYRGLRVVTAQFLARAHRLGLQVHVWTVNEPADMERLLDLGVDGLVTDRADVLRSVLEGRGEWPPGL
ncbi:glycerophosphodiester phosphodiesterase [Sinomonas sp. JC656]|uniref:Glycerophosphodiester phosphodiesterase n=2 Tax=Sinomonas cellulolyticus TaxID=2801916 RepID=A0ABS1K7G4_9MICC|nr:MULTISPECIES: glycerophosphodiester phosphodiesterase [Sinomonas]MBL0706842.1 glycerophosphodiester phosphodiesterase [Sinomonas cellulolyticus]